MLYLAFDMRPDTSSALADTYMGVISFARLQPIFNLLVESSAAVSDEIYSLEMMAYIDFYDFDDVNLEVPHKLGKRSPEYNVEYDVIRLEQIHGYRVRTSFGRVKIIQRTEIMFYSDRGDEMYCSEGFHVDDIRCILKDSYAPGDTIQS